MADHFNVYMAEKRILIVHSLALHIHYPTAALKVYHALVYEMICYDSRVCGCITVKVLLSNS